tara:strand:+ start:469 stop:666 length:198 start_codon:yes stop_codon:yes gene_type:complete
MCQLKLTNKYLTYCYCLNKSVSGAYCKYFTSSQSHKVHALLINKYVFFGFYIKTGALKDVKKEKV